MTNTQIDNLGERLKQGIITDDDLRLLDKYRRSFASGYWITVDTIRRKMGLSPTGRPAKSTTSIIDKLKRESIRLTQIQDIAGCRIIVPDIAAQETIVKSITEYFDNIRIIDRREKPSYGYRAIHLIVKCDGKIIEVQIRTSLQHRWAELSEKISDVKDPMIKYGAGDKIFVDFLAKYSTLTAEIEMFETSIDSAYRGDLTPKMRQEIEEHRKKLITLRESVDQLLKDMVSKLENDRGGLDAFFNRI